MVMINGYGVTLRFCLMGFIKYGNLEMEDNDLIVLNIDVYQKYVCTTCSNTTLLNTGWGHKAPQNRYLLI